MTDAAYREALERLYRRRRFGMRPGLEVVRALLGALGDPQASFRAIHVAGSKGKGSVAAMAAAILSAAGRRTALFTSPHLQSFRERIAIDRVPIPPEAVVAGLDRVDAAAARLEAAGAIDRAPTFFETTTALAFDWFRAQGIRDAVVEVGLGGRLDATNVLDAPVGVVTTIELEHTEVLGPTLAHVAREKAGILHAGMHAVVGEAKPEPRAEIDRHAAHEGVPVWHLGADLAVDERSLTERGQAFAVATPHGRRGPLRLPLLGAFQPANAALAVAAVDLYARATGLPLPDAAVRRGLAGVRWRGRLERVARRPELFVDVAHTVESAAAVARSFGEIAPLGAPSENVVVFGCLADKPAERILDALAPLAHTVVLVPVRSERAAAPEALRLAAAGRFRRIVVAPSTVDGLAVGRAATDARGFTLVTGSDYLVGEVLTQLEGTPADEPELSDPVGPPPVASAGDGGPP